jgi:hypothetical protein
MSQLAPRSSLVGTTERPTVRERVTLAKGIATDVRDRRDARLKQVSLCCEVREQRDRAYTTRGA